MLALTVLAASVLHLSRLQVPETTPAWLRPMSMQNAQEGGSVMSAPKTAMGSWGRSMRSRHPQRWGLKSAA